MGSVSIATQSVESDAPVQIGIILCANIATDAVPALKFLLLQLNTLQTSFEYQCLPGTGDPLLAKLANREPISRIEVEADLERFASNYREYLRAEAKAYELSPKIPRHLIIVSRATFDDEYYMTGAHGVGIIALGLWERVMAPPSLVEFILSVVVSSSLYALDNVGDVSHYGTKGCLFDFNADLSNARFMALQGFICSECRLQLEKNGYSKLATELTAFLSKKWLGQVSDPTSPAGMASKLGYDLFTTKGLTPRWSEKFLSGLKEDGVKEIVRIVGEILLATLLLALGLKEISKSSEKTSAASQGAPQPVATQTAFPAASPPLPSQSPTSSPPKS